MPLKEFGLVLWQGRARARRRGLTSLGPVPAVAAVLCAVAGASLLLGAWADPGLGAMWSLGVVLLTPALMMLAVPPLRMMMRWFAS